MKGLRRYISPFAPDQSGAAAVLCEMGGLIVICDAGGCAGNICGFDEPRWFAQKSAIFSAGLRDMDAILGRDDRLVSKIASACEKIEGEFVSVIGTPVPAVIGTDYHALKKMLEKKTKIPVLTIDTNGMELYDVGAGKAFLELMRTFVKEKTQTRKGVVGILGATPLDLGMLSVGEELSDYLKRKGYREGYVYGMGAGIDPLRQAANVEKNIVISPAGLPAARYLEKEYGVPYEMDYPPEWIADYEKLLETMRSLPSGARVLLVHQQVLANALRQAIRKEKNLEVTVASWFLLDREGKEERDFSFKEEDQWVSHIQKENYDIIVGDPLFLRAIPEKYEHYFSLPHVAVSGKKREKERGK